jgi:hypothetical protein
MFWRSFGMVFAGVLLCVVITRIRDTFYDFIQNYLQSGLSLNATNESLTLVGDLLFGFAILFAPIALIQTTEAYQPIFVLISTFVLSQLFGVASVREDYSRAALIKKGLGIICVLIGSLLLVLNNLI